MAGLTIAISLIWFASWIFGLPVTQALAALLVLPYAGGTAYLAWAQVRTRPT
jgi:hypothetical protein